MKKQMNSNVVYQISSRLLVISGIMMLLWLGSASPTVGQGTTLPQTPLSSGANLSECLGETRSAFHAQTGKVRFVGTMPGKPLARSTALSQSASAVSVARDYLSRCGSLFGLRDQASELIVKREQTADRGRSVVRFQQVYQGIPILGGELIVNLDSAKNILSVNGEILPNVSVKTTPAVNATAAQDIALQAVAKKYQLDASALIATQPQLWIYNPIMIRPGSGFTRLVWRMEVTPKELLPIRELVLVDAQRGGVALSFNQIDTVRNRETYTANNGTSLPGTLVCNESNPTCSGGDAHAVAAHTYAGDTYDFYFAYHGRDSINNAGMTMRSTVHYGTNYRNAFWNGSQMVYGDGYGFALADDVVAHEFTHGVTDYESNLFYYYQSGAINESFSDLWGEFVDLTNGKGNDAPSVRWLLGEDISGLGATRNMQNPPAFGDPDKMTSPYYYTGASDNGGVHTNSGVNNKAVYLMTDGGTFNGYTVTGLGITKVAKIYYEVQTHLLTSGSDYADLYEAVYQACLNLIGTSGITFGDCQQVRNATLAVEMNQQPVPGYNPDAPICPSGQSPVNLFFDNLESGSGNWTFGALSGTSRWGRVSGYAYSGMYSLYGDDYPATVSDSYAAMNTSVTLPANAYLHFTHAYGFEDPSYDGGVLEYSTNGGASWSDAGSLFDYNGYKGTIASVAGNPLAGRSGFIGDSHGYISSRLNLASLAGQSVRFRWRMGTDTSLYDLGWLVDDVRIYTCSGAPLSSVVYLPLVLKGVTTQQTGIYGRVTQGGLAAAGVLLELRFYNGSVWSTYATTTTNSDGRYSFTGVPSLGSGQRYYVRYWNPGDIGRLRFWYTRALTSYTAGSSVAIGDFDIADIPMVAPANGATVTLPYTFQWKLRPATPTDSYEFNLFDPSDRNPWWWTDPPLGYVGSYTLKSLPSGFNPFTQYGWNLWVYSSDGGYGESYYYRAVTFSNYGSALELKLPAVPKGIHEDIPRR